MENLIGLGSDVGVKEASLLTVRNLDITISNIVRQWKFIGQWLEKVGQQLEASKQKSIVL